MEGLGHQLQAEIRSLARQKSDLEDALLAKVLSGEIQAYSEEFWIISKQIEELAFDIIEAEDRYNEND